MPADPPNVVVFNDGEADLFCTYLKEESDNVLLVVLRKDGKRKFRIPWHRVVRVEDREASAHANAPPARA